MKSLTLKIVLTLFLSVLSASSIAATLFDRDDFGANAVEFGFDGLSDGTIIAGAGNLVVNSNFPGIFLRSKNLNRFYFKFSYGTR